MKLLFVRKGGELEGRFLISQSTQRTQKINIACVAAAPMMKAPIVTAQAQPRSGPIFLDVICVLCESPEKADRDEPCFREDKRKEAQGLPCDSDTMVLTQVNDGK
jgi:hypothetical protein